MNTELIGDFIDAAVQDQSKAKLLYSENPELREARWLLGETVLHFLAVEGCADAVGFLGNIGFDPNLVNDLGNSPLLDVAILGNDRVAEVLLSIGADPNATSLTWDNVLHAAVRSGNARLVELLLAAGAKTDYVTDLGETVLDALPEKHPERTSVEDILQKYGIHRGAT
jgi:ankyrin repeat protein